MGGSRSLSRTCPSQTASYHQGRDSGRDGYTVRVLWICPPSTRFASEEHSQVSIYQDRTGPLGIHPVAVVRAILFQLSSLPRYSAIQELLMQHQMLRIALGMTTLPKAMIPSSVYLGSRLACFPYLEATFWLRRQSLSSLESFARCIARQARPAFQMTLSILKRTRLRVLFQPRPWDAEGEQGEVTGIGIITITNSN